MKTDSNLCRDKPSDHHRSIQKWEVNRDRLAIMQEKISYAPKILSKSAGRSSCSIFRVPQSLIDINGGAYQPHIVSIGPYHHGEPQLQMIEEHKWRFLGSLVERMQTNKGLGLEDFLKAVQLLEIRARNCYSEIINFTTDEFIEILVLDGCFIIELFRKIGGIIPFEADDPFINMSWIYSCFLRDLVKLENQIPFFVLQCLFDLTLMPGEEETGPSLANLILHFFNNTLQRPEEVIAKYEDHVGKHLLDFLRSSFIPPTHYRHTTRICPQTRVIQSITNLRRAGIDLRPGKDESFLAIKFKRGVIEMPTIALDDFMSSFLLNCVAYEQCHGSCSKHITTYATLLDCLINTTRDVEFLSDRGIIANYFGTNAEVARFINNFGKDVSFDIDVCYLSQLFDGVNRYYGNNWHVQWAGFKFTYFNTPWSFMSALAALVLLVLTVLQTVYTIIG